jgi:hypothetical protein
MPRPRISFLSIVTGGRKPCTALDALTACLILPDRRICGMPETRSRAMQANGSLSSANALSGTSMSMPSMKAPSATTDPLNMNL